MQLFGHRPSFSEADLQEALRRKTPQLRAYLDQRIPAKLRSSISADDLLQNLYITAFKGLPSFRSEHDNSIDRWLAVIAQRQLVNAIKNARRIKRGAGAVMQEPNAAEMSSFINIWMEITSAERTPSSAAAAMEAAGSVQVALATLPESRRQAISMHFVEGKSFQEIADAMHKTTPAVRSLLFHGLRQLRDQLGRASKFLSDGSSNYQHLGE